MRELKYRGFMRFVHFQEMVVLYIVVDKRTNNN